MQIILLHRFSVASMPEPSRFAFEFAAISSVFDDSSQTQYGYETETLRARTERTNLRQCIEINRFILLHFKRLELTTATYKTNLNIYWRGKCAISWDLKSNFSLLESFSHLLNSVTVLFSCRHWPSLLGLAFYKKYIKENSSVGYFRKTQRKCKRKVFGVMLWRIRDISWPSTSWSLLAVS